MKKVCILTSVHPIFDTRIFHKEAKTLVQNGYDVTLIARHDKNEIIDGIKIIALPKSRNRLERFIKTGSLLYKKALEQKADIYHFHDPELLPWMIILKFKIRTKIIYDIHEDVPRQILNKYWLPRIIRKPIALVMSSIEWLSARVFDAIIVATPKIADRFFTVKTVRIQNFPITTEMLSANLISYSVRPPSFVYPGVIARIRGAVEMIQALALLSDILGVKLELAGNFSPNEFVNTLRALPGWTSVNYHGEISREQLTHLLGNVRAGLVLHQPVPNEIDAQPIKMFEYMAAGLPVIASDFPIWRQIIDGANCGVLVDPSNPTAIAEAMRWIIKHSAEAEAMGHRGRQAIEHKYNWNTEERKLLNLYKELIK